MKPKKTTTSRQRGIIEGYSSGLEELVAAQLEAQSIVVEYEKYTLKYTQPLKERRYTPDFLLPNGIVIETKGRFVTADRQKHRMISVAHPSLDIRFVFSNPNTRISKTSRTTYGMWCDKYGFLYSKKVIPPEWIAEPLDEDRTWAAAVAFAWKPSRNSQC